MKYAKDLGIDDFMGNVFRGWNTSGVEYIIGDGFICGARH